MTIIPSLRRPMKRKQNSLRLARTFRCESLESRRMLAIAIDVGSHTLLPNTPGQVIEITATANPGDTVTGMNFTAQLGDGDSSSNPTNAAEPNFTGIFPSDPSGVDYSGTVWDIPQGIATVPNQLDDSADSDGRADAVVIGDTGEPSYITASLLVGEDFSDCTSGGDGNICDLAPAGVIARLEIDTTGFFETDAITTFPLLLSGGDPQATSFFRSGSIASISANITNGSITIANSSPVADPVVGSGGYTIDFGGDLVLDGSESFDPDESLGDSIASYSWDINSSTFVNADTTGVNPTVSWSQLNGLGISTPGEYNVTLQVTDTFGVMGVASTTVTVSSNTIENRRLFYNNSAWDGDIGPSANDDSAIIPTPSELQAMSLDPALGKTPLFNGQTASFQNYTSYTKGINGVIIDLVNLPNALDNSDFTFRVGNNNDTSSWSLAPTPAGPNGPSDGVTVRNNAGVNGSDRVTIIWPDNSIQKQWLQVTVLANSDTGLAQNDVFYFGNAVAESGDNAFNTLVDLNDVFGARDNNDHHPFFNPALVEDAYDYNRDKTVDLNDIFAARDNGTNFFTSLRLITPASSIAGKTELKSEGESETNVILPKDFNGDGQIAISDALAIIAKLRMSSGPSLEPSPQVDLSDALAIVAELRVPQQIAYQASTDLSINDDEADELEIDLLFANFSELEL